MFAICLKVLVYSFFVLCKKVLTPPGHSELLGFISVRATCCQTENRDTNQKENQFVLLFDDTIGGLATVFGRKIRRCRKEKQLNAK
jgi:hypothetical protein